MRPHPQQTQGHGFDVLAGDIGCEKSTQIDRCPLTLFPSGEQRSKMLVVSNQFFGQGSHLFRGQFLHSQAARRRRLVDGDIEHKRHRFPPPGIDFLSVYPKKSRCNTRRRSSMMESTRSTPGPGQRETDQSSRLTQNNSNTPGGRPGGSGPQGTPPTRRVSWLRWLIFIIVINLIFYAPLLFSALGAQQSTINLSYTSFLQQVQQGNVKDVTLTGNAVSGDFKTPLHEPQSGTSSTTTYSRFTSYVPETGDPTLLPTLEKDGVQVTAQPVQTPWWQTVLTILLNALPLLLLVYFGYMAMRSILQSQQGGGILGLGR